MRPESGKVGGGSHSGPGSGLRAQSVAVGMERKGEGEVARRSLMGPVEDGLWGVRRRRSLASGTVAGPPLGWGCRRRNRSWGRSWVRSLWGSPRRWWRPVAAARASQEGAQPWGGVAGILLIEDSHADAAGLHAAVAYHQIPPAKLIFLQPELHSEVHACVCLYDLVIEGPGDAREEEGGGAGDREGIEGGRSSQHGEWLFQDISTVGLHVAWMLNSVVSD